MKPNEFSPASSNIFPTPIIKSDFLPIGTKILSRHQAGFTKHWSEISDDADVDIKFIWEPSRFGMVYSLVRAYAATQDEKYAEAFWELIQVLGESQSSQHGTQLDGRTGSGPASHGMDIWLLRLPWILHPQLQNECLNSSSWSPLMPNGFTRILITPSPRTAITPSAKPLDCGWLGLLFPELKDSEKYLALGRQTAGAGSCRTDFPRWQLFHVLSQLSSLYSSYLSVCNTTGRIQPFSIL